MAPTTNNQVRFHHPLIVQDLVIRVKPDQITWGYGLNTQSFPTFGGEVVQILSVYFDDMTISGTISTYREMELIYSWFIAYMQYATQGVSKPQYDQTPVDFYYDERNWHFQIWPLTAPSFRYGRDVVAPTWQLTAAVHESDNAFTADFLMPLATFNAQTKGITFGKVTGDFGALTNVSGSLSDLVNNPWASPDADPEANAKGSTVNNWVSKEVQAIGDQFVAFTQDFNNSTLGSLPQFNKKVSQAPNLQPPSGKKSTSGSSPGGKPGSPSKP